MSVAKGFISKLSVFMINDYQKKLGWYRGLTRPFNNIKDGRVFYFIKDQD